MDLGLRNRVAVVAASSKGIGQATAECFAREGARLVMNGRDKDALREAVARVEASTGVQVEAVPADLATPEGCDQLIERAVDRFGDIDALVTNTGGPPSSPFEVLDDAAWQAAIDLLLFSVVRLTRAALPYLRRSGGSVVNVTSITVREPHEGLVLSNSLRPAVVGLAKTLARELGGEGIRFNGVAPGHIWTARQEYLVGTRARRAGVAEDEIKRNVEGEIPLGRYGTPQEVANLIVFLSSPAAAYISGTTTMVDGGLHRGLI